MQEPRVVHIGNLSLANNQKIKLIAGPCALESKEHAFEMAGALTELSKTFGIGLIYKTSYDKANRTSVDAKRGLGIEESLPIFEAIRNEFKCPVLTDIHTVEEAVKVSKSVDVLQIPAFLCRQTDLLIAAGQTGRVLHVKKGQFMAPWDMKNVVRKIESTGNENILLCERGASFGYNALVSDMRSLPILAQTGYPVIFDATHSVQQPGGQGTATGGDRKFAPILARAAVAVGVAGVFIETHRDPNKAPSDGPNMIYLKDLPEIIETLLELDSISKAHPIAV